VIRTVAETASTNADMLAAAQSGVAEGVWLRAERQTAGRGRQGRTWVSPVGNLYASTLVRLRPTDPPAPTLALVVAVAVEEAVRTHLEAGTPPSGSPARNGSGGSEWDRVAGLTLKWPNDLLFAGGKLAGILLERAGELVVAGVGINLRHRPELPDRATACLADCGVTVEASDLAGTLADAFARWLALWRGEGVAPVRARWLERAHPAGTALTVRLPDATEVAGLFDGLDAGGALILRLAAGERRVIHAGDVFLL